MLRLPGRTAQTPAVWLDGEASSELNAPRQQAKSALKGSSCRSTNEHDETSACSRI